MKKKMKIETPNDKLKYEIAKELGLMEKIEKLGWGGLTAKESGRIGGIMTIRNREKLKSKDKNSKNNDN